MPRPSLDKGLLKEHIRQELPHLSASVVSDLADALQKLIAALKPELIYLFGSQARGEATPDSDFDLLLVVSFADEPTYRLAQAAYQAVGLHSLPMDILVMTRQEFERRSRARASLPATVLREGRMLYAA